MPLERATHALQIDDHDTHKSSLLLHCGDQQNWTTALWALCIVVGLTAPSKSLLARTKPRASDFTDRGAAGKMSRIVWSGSSRTISKSPVQNSGHTAVALLMPDRTALVRRAKRKQADTIPADLVVLRKQTRSQNV